MKIQLRLQLQLLGEFLISSCWLERCEIQRWFHWRLPDLSICSFLQSETKEMGNQSEQMKQEWFIRLYIWWYQSK